MVTAGIDIGSRTIKALLFDGESVIGSEVIATGATPKESGERLIKKLLSQHAIVEESVTGIAATGYGRNYFEMAHLAKSEIICHAAGVVHLHPDVQTIIDIGGQDSKMIEVGAKGRVKNFVMNDRCAAGTGKFIEMVATTLNIPLQETGELSLTTNEVCEISSMCAVFAESEIIGLLHKGVAPEIILRGVFRSVAKRTIAMGGKIGFNGSVVFTGGVAQNSGIVEALKGESGVSTIIVPTSAQLTGALGAAIIAQTVN